VKDLDMKHHFQEEQEGKYSLVNLGRNKISQWKSSSIGQLNIFKKQSSHN
jgi:hypothetical protein